MRLDASIIRYLTSVEWRVLIAVEMGLKNHELVPVSLITRIANLRRTGIQQVLSNLLKHKLLAHDRSTYDGYKLTYLGYDFLALRALAARGSLVAVGMRMGVGKESDIHICEGADGQTVILKLHRLGRVSFRSIKRNRDYMGQRQSASWMYLARLAAAKEFAYMKALHEYDFPVPKPLDVNRHAIVMEYIDAYPLSQVRELQHPQRVLENLMALIVRFAESGLIHGDFNEFNLMINDAERLTVIDFPQIVGVHHPDAEMYFNRDVECIRTLFRSRFGIDVTQFPRLKDVTLPETDTKSLAHRFQSHVGEEKRLLEEWEAYLKEKRTRQEEPEPAEDDHLSDDSSASEKTDTSENTITPHRDECHKEKVRLSLVLSSDVETEALDEPASSALDEKCPKLQGVSGSNVEEDSNTSTEEDEEEEEDAEEEREEEENVLDLPPKRLDNVWTPVVRRYTAKNARDQVAAARKKKQNKIFGNAGAKKDKQKRRARNEIKHEW